MWIGCDVEYSTSQTVRQYYDVQGQMQWRNALQEVMLMASGTQNWKGRDRAAVLVYAAVIQIAASAAAGAQAGTRPSIRDIGAVIAKATVPFLIVSQLIPLSGGRVAVNDARMRHVIILDSTLTHEIVALDTTGDAQRAYGRGGQIVRYRDDTLLFADVGALAMIAIDPTGHVGKTVAFPSLPPANAAVSYIDPRGRLIYQSRPAPGGGLGRGAGRGAGRGGSCVDIDAQDSTAIIRANLQTRVVDTIGFVRQDKLPCPLPVPPEPGAVIRQTLVQPVFQRPDAWAMLSDGTVAFIRAATYSIDWVDLDGGHRSTPRIPADWHHLSDSDKVMIVDSLQGYRNANATGFMEMQDGTRRPMHDRVEESRHVPDYAPVFTGEPIIDTDGNIWVREAVWHLPYQPPVKDAPVYDLVNRAGELIDRVRIPGGTTLVGFGPRVAYLSSREGSAVSLVRVRVH